MTNNTRIRVIESQDWRGFVSWNTGSGNLEAVCDATIYDSFAEKDCPVCVKFYPPDSRGIVNEVTGWLMADALKLPQPQAAYLIHVPLSSLAQPLPDWMRQIKRDKAQHYWAFASARIDAQNAAKAFPKRPDKMIGDILRWESLFGAVALDEHIANTDRHLNNLLRLGKGQYALIDNGRLAVENTEKDWQIERLDPNRNFRNTLSERCWQDKPDRATASAVIAEGVRHPDALGTVRDELEAWWRDLIFDDADRDAFRSFITERAALLSELLSTRYHLLRL